MHLTEITYLIQKLLFVNYRPAWIIHTELYKVSTCDNSTVPKDLKLYNHKDPPQPQLDKRGRAGTY